MTHLDELIALCKHPKIQGRRGEWCEGDMYFDGNQIGYVEEYCLDDFNDNYHPNCQWIPKLSDPIQPERGLIGMLEGNWVLSGPCADPDPYGVLFFDESGMEILRQYYGPTPEIAVCRAIVVQEEEK